MAAPGQSDPQLLEDVEAILAEAKHVERRARLLKQMSAQLIDTLQSKEDTRKNGTYKQEQLEEI